MFLGPDLKYEMLGCLKLNEISITRANFSAVQQNRLAAGRLGALTGFFRTIP